MKAPTRVRIWKSDSREAAPNLAGPIEQAAEGHVMPGVYLELRAFVLAHGKCAGRRRADVSLFTPSGYSLLLKCGCGQEFSRWVTPEDADEDRLRSALLVFEN
jgi:hypothetical protein